MLKRVGFNDLVLAKVQADKNQMYITVFYENFNFFARVQQLQLEKFTWHFFIIWRHLDCDCIFKRFWQLIWPLRVTQRYFRVHTVPNRFNVFCSAWALVLLYFSLSGSLLNCCSPGWMFLTIKRSKKISIWVLKTTNRNFIHSIVFNKYFPTNFYISCVCVCVRVLGNAQLSYCRF